jgi:hypothetical protein
MEGVRRPVRGTGTADADAAADASVLRYQRNNVPCFSGYRDHGSERVQPVTFISNRSSPWSPEQMGDLLEAHHCWAAEKGSSSRENMNRPTISKRISMLIVASALSKG